MVPVSTASCANAVTGSRRIAPISTTRLAKPQVMESPSIQTRTAHRSDYGAPETSASGGVKSRKTLTLALQREHGFKIVFGIDISWIALHGSTQNVRRLRECAFRRERCAEMPFGLRGGGLQLQ